MKGNNQVIAQLNELLAAELTAIDQYFIHSRMYENWRFSKLYECIAHEVQDETNHADALINAHSISGGNTRFIQIASLCRWAAR